jgi:hypothetical protein
MHRWNRSCPRRRSPALGVQALEAREVPASISGRVFSDYNYSATMNGPDAGLAGATITLHVAGSTEAPRTTTSDAQGYYTFDDLPAGVYTIEVSPTDTTLLGKATIGTAGGSLTRPYRSGGLWFGDYVLTEHVVYAINLNDDTAATGYDFALIPLLSIGGSVYEDVNGNGVKDPGEPGIPNVKITMAGVAPGGAGPGTILGTGTGPGMGTGNGTTTTDADGNYIFTRVRPGIYVIGETQPAGYSDGEEQRGTPSAVAPKGGLSVDLLQPGDKFLGIDLTQSAEPSGGFNFGEIKGGTLSGAVYSDVDDDGVQAATGEPGIPGVKIRLTGTDDQGTKVDRTVLTGKDGTYTFEHVRPGNYAVREVQPPKFKDGKEAAGSAGGTVTVNDRITDIAFPAGAALTGYSFGERAWVDLRLVQKPSTAVVGPGGTVSIVYVVKNVGSATVPAPTIQFKYGGLRFVSNDHPSGGTFDPVARTWTIGDLPPGGSQTIRLVLRAPTAGTYRPSAKATTTAPERRAGNNGVAWTVTAGAGPSLKTAVSGTASGWWLGNRPLG